MGRSGVRWTPKSAGDRDRTRIPRIPPEDLDDEVLAGAKGGDEHAVRANATGRHREGTNFLIVVVAAASRPRSAVFLSRQFR
jgi:hypothetical protein